MKKAAVVEIFSSIQGEGTHIGERHLFLRFCGCNLKCNYCDTPFDVDDCAKIYFQNEIKSIKNPISACDLAEEINEFNPLNHTYLSLTGGEPLLHFEFLKEFLPIVELPIYLETNGTLFENLKEIIDLTDVIAADIKLPSSTGLRDYFEEHKKFIQIAKEHKKEIFLKAVVSEKITKEEINILEQFSKSADLIVQPVDTKEKDAKLSKDKLFEIMTKIPNARIIPQCHKFLNIM